MSHGNDPFCKAIEDQMEMGREKWEALHALCPKCKTENYETTCSAMPVNHIRCECGWRGREWELMPKL